MANTFSSLKRVRTTAKQTEVNRMRRTRMRTVIKAVRKALDKKDVQAAEKMMPQLFSMVDRAAKWGIIKKNTAARYKSRITHRVRKISQSA
jgi:small subunit ribosomal protein S20